MIFLKTKQHRHHFLGLGVVVTALFLVGLSSFVEKSGTPSTRETNVLGIVMMLLSLLFSGIQFVVEEALLSKYSTHPLKVVGYEGLWGTLVYEVTLVIMQHISCDGLSEKVRADLCAVNDLGEWRLEDTIFALRQMAANGFLFFLVIGVTFTIAFYNFCGVSVTR